MAENYKHLYQQMKKMVEKYQDEIVPGLRKVIENIENNRVEVVRCKDCKHFWNRTSDSKGYQNCPESGMRVHTEAFCSYGERREDG